MGTKSIANARLAGIASSSFGALRMQLDYDAGAYCKRCASCVYEADARTSQGKKSEAVMRQAGPGTPGAHDTAAPRWEYIGAITPGWKYTSVRVCYVCVAVVVIVISSNVLKILYLVVVLYQSHSGEIY